MKFNTSLAAFLILSASACTTVSSYENINGQKVAVGHTNNGQTIKRFAYREGTSLTVRYGAANAAVTHVLEYPASDAQKRDFVNQATGCRAGDQLNQFNQMAQGGITITNYQLICR